MTELSYLFIPIVALAGLLTMVAVWAPRQLWVKLGSIVVATMFLPVAYAGFASLLSKPKPVSLEWWQQRAKEATVLGSNIQEDQGIYLWLQLANVAEPRAYVMPWDRKLAEQLQEAMRRAEENGGQLTMRLPFEPSLDDREPKFYALPQPAPPPKDLHRPPPKFYQHARRFEREA